jgi:hypothetical protein
LIDKCIYLKFYESRFINLILYIDDILLTDTDKDTLHHTKFFI